MAPVAEMQRVGSNGGGRIRLLLCLYSERGAHHLLVGPSFIALKYWGGGYKRGLGEAAGSTSHQSVPEAAHFTWRYGWVHPEYWGTQTNVLNAKKEGSRFSLQLLRRFLTLFICFVVSTP